MMTMTPLRSSRGQLALAVYRGDLAAAEEVLGMLAVTDPRWAVAVQAARREVHPPKPLPRVAAETYPMPGHAPGSTLGRPILLEDGDRG
jgi:hypothetical protein